MTFLSSKNKFAFWMKPIFACALFLTCYICIHPVTFLAFSMKRMAPLWSHSRSMTDPETREYSTKKSRNRRLLTWAELTRRRERAYWNAWAVSSIKPVKRILWFYNRPFSSSDNSNSRQSTREIWSIIRSRHRIPSKFHMKFTIQLAIITIIQWSHYGHRITFTTLLER